jgi:hypothetical protein
MAEAQTLLSGETELAATNTAQKLTTTSQIITGLLVRANTGNAAVVRIASSEVGSTSYPIEAGESVQFDVIDPSRIWLYGKEKDKVSYLGLIP